MKITLCDVCREEITFENSIPEGKFKTVTKPNGIFPVHWAGLREAVDTASDLCMYCLIDIIKELDDRPGTNS